MLKTIAIVSVLTLGAFAQAEVAPLSLHTRYAGIRIDEKGFITSLTSRQSEKEYSPAGHPSPLLSLHEDGQPNDKLLRAESPPSSVPTRRRSN